MESYPGRAQGGLQHSRARQRRGLHRRRDAQPHRAARARVARGARGRTRALRARRNAATSTSCSSRPVARRTLAAGAFVVAAIVVAGVLAVTTAVTWVAAGLVGADPSLVVLARGMANVWPLALFFAGLAALGCGWAHTASPVTAGALGALIAMYLFDLLGKLADAAEPLALRVRLQVLRVGSPGRDRPVRVRSASPSSPRSWRSWERSRSSAVTCAERISGFPGVPTDRPGCRPRGGARRSSHGTHRPIRASSRTAPRPRARE